MNQRPGFSGFDPVAEPALQDHTDPGVDGILRLTATTAEFDHGTPHAEGVDASDESGLPSQHRLSDWRLREATGVVTDFGIAALGRDVLC